MLELNLKELVAIDPDFDIHIELKSKTGPEGAPPVGKMIKFGDKGIRCDFGLKYTYVIPMESIKRCYAVKVSSSQVRRQKNMINRHAR